MVMQVSKLDNLALEKQPWTAVHIGFGETGNKIVADLASEVPQVCDELTFDKLEDKIHGKMFAALAGGQDVGAVEQALEENLRLKSKSSFKFLFPVAPKSKDEGVDRRLIFSDWVRPVEETNPAEKVKFSKSAIMSGRTDIDGKIPAGHVIAYVPVGRLLDTGNNPAVGYALSNGFHVPVEIVEKIEGKEEKGGVLIPDFMIENKRVGCRRKGHKNCKQTFYPGITELSNHEAATESVRYVWQDKSFKPSKISIVVGYAGFSGGTGPEQAEVVLSKFHTMRTRGYRADDLRINQGEVEFPIYLIVSGPEDYTDSRYTRNSLARILNVIHDERRSDKDLTRTSERFDKIIDAYIYLSRKAAHEAVARAEKTGAVPAKAVNPVVLLDKTAAEIGRSLENMLSAPAGPRGVSVATCDELRNRIKGLTHVAIIHHGYNRPGTEEEVRKAYETLLKPVTVSRVKRVTDDGCNVSASDYRFNGMFVPVKPTLFNKKGWARLPLAEHVDKVSTAMAASGADQLTPELVDMKCDQMLPEVATVENIIALHVGPNISQDNLATETSVGARFAKALMPNAGYIAYATEGKEHMTILFMSGRGAHTTEHLAMAYFNGQNLFPQTFKKEAFFDYMFKGDKTKYEQIVDSREFVFRGISDVKDNLRNLYAVKEAVEGGRLQTAKEFKINLRHMYNALWDRTNLTNPYEAKQHMLRELEAAKEQYQAKQTAAPAPVTAYATRTPLPEAPVTIRPKSFFQKVKDKLSGKGDE